ncbi:CamS sex pheromone cAM373 precursor [Paraliobacillus sp. PM-2]|uniref:CamS family sex pheromone protein n=1 Tax=Paraliobacillus sp. PM-2 TaxID=1462524 RepID=UPI00061BF024|nr:CamS family sex pheromone protein [Paraliobacillus sp. PM-2]CQR47334.1 CamS sex pheromone cAM373 precursor [Paraliobacillus sp. PM-2]
MKKKLGALCVASVVVLTSCAPSYDNQEEVVEDNTSEQDNGETAIIPSYSVSEEEYQVLLPYKLSQSRGVITNQIANRLDIDAIEQGLRRHSTEVYDPDDYYFQEGQKLTSDIVYDWLERYAKEDTGKDNPLGLNPAIPDVDESKTEEKIEAERNNPKYLSHILEQDYLIKTSENAVQLGGVSIAIAMKSNYRFQTEVGGPYYYEDISMKKMMDEANKIAKEVVNRMRQMDGLADVPIMLAIYREEARDSLVPGNFVAKTNIKGGSSSIKDWEEINEEYVLFPSHELTEIDPDTNANLEDFEDDISEYFPNYVGVIGEGFYINDQLKKLTLEIPIRFNGKAEVVGFTQYVYGLIVDGFKNHFELEVNITSNNKQESLIYRKAGDEEPNVHIYD